METFCRPPYFCFRLAGGGGDSTRRVLRAQHNDGRPRSETPPRYGTCCTHYLLAMDAKMRAIFASPSAKSTLARSLRECVFLPS